MSSVMSKVAVQSNLVKEKVLTSNVSDRLNDWRFASKAWAGYTRGAISTALGRVRYEDEERPLLIGSKTLLHMESRSCIRLFGNGTMGKDISVAKNPLFPSASSIGFIPHWKFLNPPVAKPTEITLRKDAKLSLGPDVLICRGTYIGVGAGRELKLNEGVYIGHETYIATRCGLEVGRGTLIGHQTIIIDYDGHPIFYPGQAVPQDTYGGTHAEIVIEENVWIGFRCTILKGVRIGKGSIVGANSSVTSDVPPYSIVAGNPARVIKENISWKEF